MLLKIFIYFYFSQIFCNEISPKYTRIWGPGLSPRTIIMPARYFFIETRNKENIRINSSYCNDFTTAIEGTTNEKRPCRIWTNKLDRKDGTYIIRYKIFDCCYNLKISILYSNEHVADSPYKISGKILPDHCDCPKNEIKSFLNELQCKEIPKRIKEDLQQFKEHIDWDILRDEIVQRFDKPYSISLCHYVIKNNEIYRKCYGEYVGFKMFMDNILLSLARKTHLPDNEFFVNLGDWPLVNKNEKILPIFSWCGSNDTYDIVMPTYDITESTLENMGRVMLDMLSVQGNTKEKWKNRTSKAFWRGRDSSRERLKLIEIARKHPDLFDCALTNFFFFRDEEKIYGPKVPHVSFYTFFDYKYQLGLDGTVASYRFPYLLGGGSLIFKQDSKYYEHFYDYLIPYVHYVPIKKNLDDVIEKIKWALDNDEEARKIAENGLQIANEYLLPKNIFCYYGQLLSEFSKKIVSSIKVLDNMEKVSQKNVEQNCDCTNYKDEL